MDTGVTAATSAKYDAIMVSDFDNFMRQYVRSNSIAAYHEINADELLSKKRREVYNILWKHGPLSASEIGVRIHGRHSPGSGPNISSRLNYLGRATSAKVIAHKTCQFTGKTVHVWDVTANLPQKVLNKPVTTREILIKMCDLTQRALHGLELSKADEKKWGKWMTEARELLPLARERTKNRSTKKKSKQQKEP